jgi:hypothetical protein
MLGPRVRVLPNLVTLLHRRSKYRWSTLLAWRFASSRDVQVMVIFLGRQLERWSAQTKRLFPCGKTKMCMQEQALFCLDSTPFSRKLCDSLAYTRDSRNLYLHQKQHRFENSVFLTLALGYKTETSILLDRPALLTTNTLTWLCFDSSRDPSHLYAECSIERSQLQLFYGCSILYNILVQLLPVRPSYMSIV